jgi:ubiquinone/menaquinone biosynthesis C-methylase UbiE
MKNSNLNLSKLKTKNINYRKYLIKKTKLSISEITRLSYDLQSGSYIKNYQILKKNKKKYKIFQNNIKELNERINFKKIETILDFGTGEGLKLPYLLKFNKNVKKIYACDISFNRLCYASDFLKRNLNKKEMSKLSLFCNKDFELPFKSNSIEVVFSSGVFENLSNKNMNKLLLELFRVTQQRLILIEPIKNDLLRLKKYQLNFNLNYYLKKNKINFNEHGWQRFNKNKTKYSMRIIDKKTIYHNNSKFYLEDRNLSLYKKDNFFYDKTGKITPIIGNITIFRPLEDLNFFKSN